MNISDDKRFHVVENTGYGNIVDWSPDHVCVTPPITINMGGTTMWKCGECGKIWRITSIFPFPEDFPSILSKDSLRWIRAPEYDNIIVLKDD